MTYLIILGVYLAILFAAAWLSRRNLGVPTLALASGALLADAWANSLAVGPGAAPDSKHRGPHSGARHPEPGGCFHGLCGDAQDHPQRREK